MEKKLIVQLGHVETRRFYHDFIAFDGEYYKGKKEIYSTFNNSHYIDSYYYDDEVTIEIEHNFGIFSSDHYDQLTHDIILFADDQKNVSMKQIKNLVKTYKNANNL